MLRRDVLFLLFLKDLEQVHMYHASGYTIKDISTSLNLPESTVSEILVEIVELKKKLFKTE